MRFHVNEVNKIGIYCNAPNRRKARENDTGFNYRENNYTPLQGSNKSQCNHCGQFISNNLETLRNHLESVCQPNNPDINMVFTPTKKRKLSEKQEKELNEGKIFSKEEMEYGQQLLANALFSCAVPHSFTEQEEFRTFLTFISPNFKPPNQEKVGGDLLDNRYFFFFFFLFLFLFLKTNLTNFEISHN